MHRRGNYITIFSSQADLIDRFSFDYAQAPLRKMLASDPLWKAFYIFHTVSKTIEKYSAAE